MGVYYQKGRYRCQITDQGIGESKTGTPQFVLRFQVFERNTGPDAWEPVSAQYERTAYMAITDKTMEYFIKKIHALGFSHGSLRFLDPATPGYQNFAGTMADFNCSIEQHFQTGDDIEKWDLAFGNESAPLELKPVDQNKLRQLDVLFGAAAKGAKPTTPKPAGTPRPRQQSERVTLTPADVGTLTMPPPHPSADVRISDEDIPF